MDDKNRDELFERGLWYYDKQNLNEAVAHLRKATDMGHMGAFGILARIYTLTPPNPEYDISPWEYLEILMKYANLDKPNLYAQLFLGKILIGNITSNDDIIKKFGQYFAKDVDIDKGIWLVDQAVKQAEELSISKGREQFEQLGADYIEAATAYHVQASRILQQEGIVYEYSRLLEKTKHCYDMAIAWAKLHRQSELMAQFEWLAEPTIEQLKQFNNIAVIYDESVELMNANPPSSDVWMRLYLSFVGMQNHKDSVALAEKCDATYRRLKQKEEIAEEAQRKDDLLEQATQKGSDVHGLSEAIKILEGLEDYKNAASLIADFKKQQADCYAKAQKFLENAQYLQAWELFVHLADYADACEQAAYAHSLVEKQKKKVIRKRCFIGVSVAAALFTTYMLVSMLVSSINLQRLTTAREQIEPYQGLLAASNIFLYGGRTSAVFVGVRGDGTVIASGDNDVGQLDVDEWRDVVAVSTSGRHTVGLLANGTVVATGDNFAGQLDVQDWRNVVSISTAHNITLGLRTNGTVVGAGLVSGTDFSDWNDIIAISTASASVAGLRENGTVVIMGAPTDYVISEAMGWQDIVAITMTSSSILGLRADGRVEVAAPSTSTVARHRNEILGWRNIVSISVGTYGLPIGLRADGTIALTGNHPLSRYAEDWQDIVAIVSGIDFIIGLTSDGTVIGDEAADGWRLFD